MKYYLVSEEQLARLSIETILFADYFTPETLLSAQRANDDCRKIELPADTLEQLETLRQLKEREKNEWVGMGDYFKHRND